MRWGATALAICMTVSTVLADMPVKWFELRPLPLREALIAFADVAGVSFSFGDLDIDPHTGNAVIGSYTTQDALAVLLSGTPFSFVETDAKTFRLVEAPLMPGMPPGQRASVAGTGGIETIVVTGTKRASLAQRLPVSISAQSGERLSRLGVRDFNALAPKLAGVAFTNLGPGRNKIFVRGVSDGSFADRTQSTVGVYLDDSPIIFNDTNPDIRLVDIDRIEIIRGPQSTLYGAGSIGGIYRIITTKPDFDGFSGRVRLDGSGTFEGGANGAADGVINVPILSDRLAMRLSGFYERHSGYIDDVSFGRDNVNESEIYGGRVAARLRLSDAWHMDVSHNLQIVDLADTQYFLDSLGPFNRSNRVAEPYRDEFKHVNVTLEGALGWADLTSATAYIDRTISNRADASLVVPELVDPAFGFGAFDIHDDIQTVNHESRLVSIEGGRVDWLLGGFYSRRKENLLSDLTAGVAVKDASSVFISDRDERVEELAFFGELTTRPFRKLAFTTGVRWSQIKSEVLTSSDGVVNDGFSELDRKSVETAYTPKMALAYQATDDFLIYVQAARGFRVGGININTPLVAITALEDEEDTDITKFEPDAIWNIELGLKTSWLDDRLVFNTSAFYTIWREIQTDQILPSGFSFVANAGDARNIGVEAEVSFVPVEDLELSAAFFWNEPELLEANPFLGAEAGNPLPSIASISASASAIYGFNLPGNWRGEVAADYSYVGESFLTFSQDLSPAMGDTHVGNIRLRAYDDRFQIGAYVENIGNSTGNTFAFGNAFGLGFQDQVTPPRPRTIGAFVEVNF